jgi:tRNA dimethylallyltransferase
MLQKFDQTKHNCIVVLGPTASGKTKLACNLAYQLNGEVISADSRQVYKHLNIGTGKDLEEYVIHEKKIPCHLINVCEPSEQFYLHDFAHELQIAFNNICSRAKLPIICGGTGLYLEALYKDFSFTQIPENKDFRLLSENKSKEELLQELEKYPPHLTAHIDINSKKRVIRGIEVAKYRLQNPLKENTELPYRPYFLGIKISKEENEKRISERLQQRLQNGLLEEAKNLLNTGITHARLQKFGLEYKYLSLFIKDELSYNDMVGQLQQSIFKFAKRQQTWFRKMEKDGVNIHWVHITNSSEVQTLFGR